jgi:predicted permease
MNDLWFGLRMLRNSPGFTVVAVLTLAFGIGINTSIFSMVSAIFLQPLPVPDADRLVAVMQRSAVWKMPHGHSWLDYQDYRAQAQSLTDLIAYLPNPVHLSAPGQMPERTWIELVSPNYFSMLGVQAGWGRLFVPGDGEGEGAELVMVLSHRYWQRRFGGNPEVVGQTIQLNGKAFTVIGVAPAEFQGAQWALAVSGFVPAELAPHLIKDGEYLLEGRGNAAWRLMGKMKPKVTLRQARAEVKVIAQRLAQDYPEAHEGAQVMVVPETSARPDPTFADFIPVFSVVFAGMVCLVLFIACANVANLMLSRMLRRRKELVVRAALGASRGRLIRQMLVESLLLALIAGAIGLILARAADAALVSFTPQIDIPLNTENTWDWRVYVFTVFISLLAGVATGLGPALQSSRFNLFESIKESGGGPVVGVKHHFRNTLVVGQVTLALVVLIGAGLFLHSLQCVKELNLGFNPKNVLMLSFDLELQGYSGARGQAFHDQLLQRTRAMPGVVAASLTQHVPFDASIQIRKLTLEDPPAHFTNDSVFVCLGRVEQNYLQTLETTLLRGRDLAETDLASAPRVAVINEAMAQHCWPGQNALGKRFREASQGPWIEVVGITATGKYVMLAEEPRPYYYLPLAQSYGSPVTLMVRTAHAPSSLVKALRELVRSLDPDLPIYRIGTMEEHIRGSVFGLMPMRLGATLAGAQGLIALLLAVMGLSAVVAYNVTQRTQEVGIRMALGAQPSGVLQAVMGESIKLTILGVLIGLVVALGFAFLLSRFLYGIGAVDAVVFLAVTVLSLGVAALASYMPARRATRIDPMKALRYE